ncbi:MAG: electron transport complex subunit E [Bacillota bacterium]|nr:electron transport complex subunit E [Bacillota bacterium]
MRLSSLTNGFFKENPTFVQLLGMCPTLAVTTSSINGLGMGLATAAVLICSNMVISLIKNLVPSTVRIPVFVVVISTFVTVIGMLMEAFMKDLYAALGLFIPLIVVNCIILARAEAFASKNSVLDSMLDGLGMGLGFTMSLTILGTVREIIGKGTFFGNTIMEGYSPVGIFVLPPGAFIMLALLLALYNSFRMKKGA